MYSEIEQVQLLDMDVLSIAGGLEVRILERGSSVSLILNSLRPRVEDGAPWFMGRLWARTQSRDGPRAYYLGVLRVGQRSPAGPQGGSMGYCVSCRVPQASFPLGSLRPGQGLQGRM